MAARTAAPTNSFFIADLHEITATPADYAYGRM
jgi:hypothetical protein